MGTVCHPAYRGPGTLHYDIECCKGDGEYVNRAKFRAYQRHGPCSYIEHNKYHGMLFLASTNLNSSKNVDTCTHRRI